MTGARNFSPWAQWQARLDSLGLAEAMPERPGDLDAWRARRRERLIELLGATPERVPLEAEVVGVERVDGYRREKVVFDAEDSMSVPAYLLVPDGRTGPGPAVLAIHGHGPGKREICGLDPSEAPGGDYAVQLVRRGFVVLAPDLRCFGERRDPQPVDRYPCDTNLVHAVAMGTNPLAQNLWDLARCLDLLESHALVDPGRIGVAGFSYGGTTSLFLAAIDPRVAAAVVSGYLSSFRSSHAVAFNLCGSQVLWGMLGELEHLDVAAQIAPRPLLVESGRQDPLFPYQVAEETVAALRRLYDHLGTPGALEHDVFDGGHRWHGERAAAFLGRHLRADTSSRPAPARVDAAAKTVGQ